jgi:hypothetical protein
MLLASARSQYRDESQPLLTALVAFLFLFVPTAPLAGSHKSGVMAYLQIPLIACIVYCTWRLLSLRGSRHKRLLTLGVYVCLCVLTNWLSYLLMVQR